MEAGQIPEAPAHAAEQCPWKTVSTYRAQVDCTPAKFEEISNVLFCQPQLNSTHLFRADILYDSVGFLQTPAQKEVALSILRGKREGANEDIATENGTACPSPISSSSLSSLDLKLTRTVVRRLIPRKPKVDRALEQTCFMYSGNGEDVGAQTRRLVIYRPHVESSSEMPWYHPSVKALAFYYNGEDSKASLSVHFLPFDSGNVGPVPDRLHKTMLSLLKTLLRLIKHDEPQDEPVFPLLAHEDATNGISVSSLDMSRISLSPSSLKDTIIPQHLIQDTYTRLKETYASDLISRWVEVTEPSKHVFEDLAIAAFLIELWKQMYSAPTLFPGFVDIACGNGVLVYILIREGYLGSGFDARRRKTWEILDINSHLTEELCIPQPFLDALESTTDSITPGITIHNGIFSPSTFIISNHADELTPWTPLLACLSSPSSPNPFLAIPCCSHALSGARHRYSPKDVTQTTITNPDIKQSKSGDLKALRISKKASPADNKSMYGCLTRKITALAQEVGCDIDLTLMRIPSTRNIGIVGNRRPIESGIKAPFSAGDVISRECRISGGIEAAAKTWVERAQKLRTGKGRGKCNEKRHEHGGIE